MSNSFNRKTEMLMHDSMCLWEAMVAARQMDRDDSTELSALWGDYGTAEMRQRCIDMVDDLNAVWDAMTEEFRDNNPFDWEFCPLFLAHVRWNYGNNVPFAPDHRAKRITAEIVAIKAMGLKESLS